MEPAERDSRPWKTAAESHQRNFEIDLPLSPPSFAVQVTAQISEKTGHLPGVAIAIMGCIVNGVGEMADADFGYVGGAPGKVRISK